MLVQLLVKTINFLGRLGLIYTYPYLFWPPIVSERPGNPRIPTRITFKLGVTYVTVTSDIGPIGYKAHFCLPKPRAL